MQTDGAVTFDRAEQPQPRSFWRLDTRALVRGVFFGLVMALFVGIGDKADAMLTGGAFPLFGGTTWAAIMGISTLLCRQPGGIIAGLVQGFVDIALGLSPLAVIFPIVNAAGSLAFSVVAARLPMNRQSHYLLAQVAGNVLGNSLVAVGIYVLLRVPIEAIVVSVGVTTVVATIAGSAVTRLVVNAVERAGLAD